MALFCPGHHVRRSILPYDSVPFGDILGNLRPRFRDYSEVGVVLPEAEFYALCRSVFAFPPIITAHITKSGEHLSCMHVTWPAFRIVRLLKVASIRSQTVLRRYLAVGSVWWSGALQLEVFLLRHLRRNPQLVSRNAPTLSCVIVQIT